MRKREVVFCGWGESGKDDGVYGAGESSSELVGSFFKGSTRLSWVSF